MLAQEIGGMFRFRFEKYVTEVIDKAKSKIDQLNAKIGERERRIVALRKEYEIDDAALVQLLTAARRAAQNGLAAMQYSYTTSAAPHRGNIAEEKAIGAGVVNNLLTENDYIESEKASVKQLTQIVNNLRPKTSWATSTGVKYVDDTVSLDYEELEFLGF